MNRTTLVSVAAYLVVAALGCLITSQVQAFQADPTAHLVDRKGDADSENLWLLLVQKAELENTYGSRHPQVISLADRIQSVRDGLSRPAGGTPGMSAAIGSDVNVPRVDDLSNRHSPFATALDKKESSVVPGMLVQPATSIDDGLSQDSWVVRVYDVSLLRPSFEVVAEARNRAGEPPQSGHNPAYREYDRGGGTGFFQIGGMRDGEAGRQAEPSPNPADEQSGSENFAKQEDSRTVTWQECLVEMVQDLTSPTARWSAGDDSGSIKIIQNHLIIRQTRRGHERVADLLEQLTLSLTNGKATVVPGTSDRPPLDPVREFSRGIDRDSEQGLNELLSTERTPELVFPGETHLTEILSQISSDLSSRTGRPVLISPDIGALEEESIDLSAVFIKDVDIPKGVMSVRSATDYILSQTDPELSLVARDGNLVVTSTVAAEAEENILLRIYDISGLLSLLRDPKSPEPYDSWQIVQIVQDNSSPPAIWFDVDGEGGRMSIVGEQLVVTQSPEGHQRVADCLEQMELSLNAAAQGLRSEPATHASLNAIREFSPQFDRIVENQLREFLRTERNPSLHFSSETSLSNVLAVLSERLTKPVLFKPDFTELKAGKIGSLDEVKMQNLDFEAGQMSVAAALDEILSRTTPKLSWIVRSNMVLLTSVEGAESEENHYLLIYDVSRIRAMKTTSGTKSFPTGASICSVVSHMTNPSCKWFETDGEGGRMVIAGDQLMVRQSHRGHRLVADILVQLVSSGRKP